MKPFLIKKRLIETLKKDKRLNEKDLVRVEKLQDTENLRFMDALIKLRYITEKEILSLLSSQCGLPLLNLSKLNLDRGIAKIIPEHIAKRHHVVVVSSVSNQITLAMADPFNMFAVDDVRLLTKKEVDIVICSEKDIIETIDKIYSEDIDMEEVSKQAGGEDAVEFLQLAHDVALEDDKVDTAPIVRVVDLVLLEAHKVGASDIHIEPFEEHVRVRYRVDGDLREAHKLAKKYQNSLTARLKILASIDITENRIPQDGRFKIRFGSKEIDYRMSVLPVYWGAKVVLRSLDQSNLRLGLDAIGFSKNSLQRFKEAVEKPFGMIIVTGPTGSGKSTTLYSILSELNTMQRNIITVEDPVEYQLSGITQIQAKPEIGLTFASGLRSILRQSPDVVMLGEIRDLETADIAIKASLTGQIVLSTLHTNDATSAITRLEDIGVEPFLISSSLNLIAAQRLCRLICPQCKIKVKVPLEILKSINVNTKELFGKKEMVGHQGKGCEQCSQTGCKGRIAIVEALIVTDQIREMIEKRCSGHVIKTKAVELGMKTLRQDALEKFTQGLISMEEVMRVTAEDR